MLHHPHLELHQAVGEQTLVLAHAAVAHLVATHVQQAVGLQGAHLGVAHRRVLLDVDQAPGRREEEDDDDDDDGLLVRRSG